MRARHGHRSGEPTKPRAKEQDHAPLGTSGNPTVCPARPAHHVGLHLRCDLPEKGKGAGLVLPYCDTEAMNERLAEISNAVDPGAHAVLILELARFV